MRKSSVSMGKEEKPLKLICESCKNYDGDILICIFLCGKGKQ